MKHTAMRYSTHFVQVAAILMILVDLVAELPTGYSLHAPLRMAQRPPPQPGHPYSRSLHRSP